MRLEDTYEVWKRPEASPAWDVGACGLMSQTGAVGVTYMSLAPVSEMDVSEMGMLRGAGLDLGREVKTAEIREDCSLFLVKLIS